MSVPPTSSRPALSLVFFLSVLAAGAETIDITSEGSASQTSEWNGGLYPAANAIDGDPATFSHTDAGTPNNAWEWTAGTDFEIARVDVSMRSDCCAGRLSGATLRLFDGEGDSVFDTSIADPGMGQTLNVQVPSGTIARSLRIGFENGATNPGANTTLVHFGEIRVFGEINLQPEIVYFTASPAAVSAGQTTTLSWQVDAADTVEISGVGPVTPIGTVNVSPGESTLFTLTATNSHGRSYGQTSVIVDGVLLAPRVTEFMASNGETLIRSDGSSPDWIEIWNPNPVALDLTGYRLTDDPEQPARFVFPAVSIGPGEFLVLDASSDPQDGVLATGFSLNRDGGSYLAFHDPQGVLLQSFTYPKQREDISYGPDISGAEKFFLIPTPGGAAVEGTVDGFVSDTQFSVDRGFYSSPQTVSVTTGTPGAVIYTTTDGSEPAPDNPAASVHSGPLAISSTTVLRAAAYLDGFMPTDVDTHTYIFAADVGAQPDSPANFPLSWVPNLNGVQANVSAFSHFGMDDSIIASLPLIDRDGLSFDLEDALVSIPTMSLVIDADVLFDPVDGLHVNARSRGRAWERPASVEYIDPATGDQKQANCGIRMHGGWNRFPEMLKKSFRLYFRSEYGDSKFRYPLFPGSENEDIDSLILRSGNGKSWASPWRALSGGGNSLERNTYMRDQLARDLQVATENEFIPGRFVHLYINGHYWGLYNPVERPSESFASARFGGDKEDYDVIKWTRGVGHRVAAGNDAGWNQLIALIRGNPASQSTYDQVAALLDLPNFVDYMLINYFIGNQDWVDNNVYAMRNRVGDGPFRFFCWDSEESLLSPGRDSTGQLVNDTCTEIHHALRNNAEYRTLFADRAQRHLFNEGALTLTSTEFLWTERAREVDRAIVGDSARWGGLLRPAAPYDRADWFAEVENIRTNYLGQRVGTTLNQLRADDLFPQVDAPLFAPVRGGNVSAGTAVTLSPGGSQGTVYFTTDGSDPRETGGGISPTARAFGGTTQEVILIPKGDVWRYDDSGADLGDSDIVVGHPSYVSSHWKHPDFDDSAWDSGPAPLGYGNIGAPVATEISFGQDENFKHTTAYFRRSFTVSNAGSFTALTLAVARDDGVVAYLNGTEIVRSEFPAGTGTIRFDTFANGVIGSAESTFLEFNIPTGLLIDGENILALELHQQNDTSSDFGFDLELKGDAVTSGVGSIPVTADTLIRARVLDGSTWSALDEALFIVGNRAADLFISELMYHPPVGGTEFLELSNRGTTTHSLNGLSFTGGIQLELSGEIAPGERLVFVRDTAAFASVWPGVPVSGVYDGALGNGGDTFSLAAGDGSILWTLTYGDSTPWPAGTDGDGYSLTFVSGSQNDHKAWRPSVNQGGSPGASDSLSFAGGDLADYALNGIQVSDEGILVKTRLGADDVSLQPEWSQDLENWSTANLLRSEPLPPKDGIRFLKWETDPPIDNAHLYFRVQISLTE